MKYISIGDRMVNVDNIESAELCASRSLRLNISGQKVYTTFMTRDDAQEKLEEIIAAKNAVNISEPAQQDSTRMEALEQRVADLEATLRMILRK